MKQCPTKPCELHLAQKCSMKKSQIQAQVFIYILVLVVAAGILIFGYNAIKGFRQQADDVLYFQFENDMKHDLQTISYQSTKTKTYNLPSFAQQVCFKTNEPNLDDDITLEENNNRRKYPLIRAAVNSNVQENVFVYPSGEKSFFTGVAIQLGTRTIAEGGQGAPINFKCFDVLGGVLNIKITGQGSYVSITDEKITN